MDHAKPLGQKGELNHLVSKVEKLEQIIKSRERNGSRIVVCLFSEVKWNLSKRALKTSDSTEKNLEKQTGEENSASVSFKPSVSV